MKNIFVWNFRVFVVLFNVCSFKIKGPISWSWSFKQKIVVLKLTVFFHASHEEKDVTNHFFGEVSCQDTTKLYKKGPLSAASANFPFCFYSAHFCFLLPLSFVVSSPICVNNTKSFLCTMWFLSRPNNFLKFFIRCKKKQFNDFLPAKKQELQFSIALIFSFSIQ